MRIGKRSLKQKPEKGTNREKVHLLEQEEEGEEEEEEEEEDKKDDTEQQYFVKNRH